MKRGLIIIIIVVVLAAISAVSLFVIFAPKLSEKNILKDPSAVMTFCKEKTSGEKQSNCYLRIAEVLTLNDTNAALQACSAISIKDKEIKEQCYGEIRDNSPDSDADIQLAICDAKTGANKDNCYRGLSENFYVSNVSKSVEICNRISEKSTKDGCLNNIIGNPEIIQANQNLAVSICDSLTLKANCYNYVAQTISGIDPKPGALICQKLSDDTQKLNCYNSAWFNFNSIVLQNPDFTISLCNALTLKRDECLRGASEIFMTTNKAKAEEICRLTSASTVEGCLHVVQNGN
jgi:hypothetical protein